MKQKSYTVVTTVKKAFRLLEILGEKGSLRPTEVAQQLKLSRSNIYRLLATLQQMGYVERTLDSRYQLNYKIFILGNTVPGKSGLSDIVRPHMAHLAEISSKETVNLAIMYESKVLYVDKIVSPHYLKLDQPIGKTDPLHCTALGKVLLSGLSEQELEVFLKSNNLDAYTKKTVTDRKVLAAAIRRVREQGYAVDLEELATGIHCIGAPIRDHTNKIIAAISISGPSLRLTEQKIEELKIPLKKTSVEISKKLGCTNFDLLDLTETSGKSLRRR